MKYCLVWLSLLLESTEDKIGVADTYPLENRDQTTTIDDELDEYRRKLIHMMIICSLVSYRDI